MKRVYSVILAASVAAAVPAYVCAAPSLPANRESFPGPLYPESAGVRSGILESWLTAGTLEVSALDPVVVSDTNGFSYLVSRKRDAAAGLFEISVEPYNARSVRGKWSLFRRLSDGSPERIVLFPGPDEAVRLELRPSADSASSDKSRADLIVYGQYAARSVPVGLPFVRLYSLSLSDLYTLTETSIPWDLAAPDNTLYADIESAVAEIRDALPSLVYLDDGAFDEHGYPVLIRDGSAQDPQAVRNALANGQDIARVAGGVNCSGFAKWIIDGIVRPRAGSQLFIDPLKTPTAAPNTHFTEPYRESRDLFFGLDWTRNLASAVVSLSAGATVRPDESGVDVTVNPFSGASGYKPAVGYRMSELVPVLYWLAVRERGHLYLGAVSRERGTPPLRQYHHIAAFFPWFDSTGRFRLTVFESAAETESAEFVSRNADAWIHLVRVRAPEAGYFVP